MINILCYGDSNTHGYNPEDAGRYDRNVRWTGLLQKMLGSGFCVIEEGLNGRTTAYDRPEAAWKNGLTTLTPVVATHLPLDLVIIMLGTNDCNVNLGLGDEDIKAGTEKLVDAVRDTAALKGAEAPEILIVAPAPIGENYEDSRFAGDLSEDARQLSLRIPAIQQQVAIEKNCAFINAGDFARVSDIDSEHLTVAGHLALAEALYGKIMELYPAEDDDFFDPDTVIETERLEMRMTLEDDAEDLFENVFGSELVLRYFISKKYEDAESCRQYVAQIRRRSIEGKRYNLSIVEKESGRVIGIMLQCSKQDELFVGTEVGYAIGEKYWGKGYTTEALRAFIDFLFAKGVHRVCASHYVENPASGRVMEKCGMTPEGTFKDEVYYHDAYGSLKYWSIINPKQ